MRYFSLLLLFTLFTACGPSYVYQENHVIAPDQGWTHDNPLVFAFEISDTNQLYNLHLILDHTTTFATQNTYVLIRTVFPDGKQLEEEVSLQMANKFGQWFGECDAENCTLDIPIQQNAFFNAAGNYRVEIEQYGRENPLLGVNRVGFALEKIGVKE